MHAMSAKIEDLATPLTSPSNSPPPKALFLPSDLSQPPLQPQPTDLNLNFYQPYYDRQTPNSVLNVPTGALFGYDELGLSWLESFALDDNYNLSLQNNDDVSLMNL